MVKNGINLTVAALIVAVTGTIALDRPERAAFGQTTSSIPDLGTEWTPIDRLFDQDGSLNQNLTKRVRTELEFQSAGFEEQHGSASTHGFSEGDVPPLTYCPGARETDYVSFPPPEYDDFDLHVLLSEVAVYAQVVDVVPGLSSLAEPTALLVLSDVTPLRSAVPAPSFALVPLGQLVVRDSVVCSPVNGYVDANLVPKTGMEIVMISNWRGHGVVLGHVGLAVVSDDGALSWVYGPTGPSTMDELTDQMIGLESRGAFGVTRDFVRWDPTNAGNRQRFIAEWNRLRESGCMDNEPMERTSDGRLSTSTCPADP